MDYPPRNTDSAKKYGLERENTDSGHGKPLPLMGRAAFCQCREVDFIQQPVNRRIGHCLLQVLAGK
jgi:hypothetical protein